MAIHSDCALIVTYVTHCPELFAQPVKPVVPPIPGVECAMLQLICNNWVILQRNEH